MKLTRGLTLSVCLTAAFASNGAESAKKGAPPAAQLPIQDYEPNLNKITARLKERQAKLIWATTSPVPQGPTKPPRRVEDVQKYNAVAAKVMNDASISINDLYILALPKLPEIQLPKNVHFTPAGCKVLAEQVVKSIEQAMH